MEKTEKRAKLFMNGRSQAVRLPREFRFEGTEVRVIRSGNGVLLEPVSPQLAAGDLDRVRRLMEALAPIEPELAASMKDAVRRLEAAAGQQ